MVVKSSATPGWSAPPCLMMPVYSGRRVYFGFNALKGHPAVACVLASMASELFYQKQHHFVLSTFNIHVVLVGSHVFVSSVRRIEVGDLWRWQRLVAAARRF